MPVLGTREDASSSSLGGTSAGAVIGIAVGVSVGLFFALSGVLLVSLHLRQKRQRAALTEAALNRRLSTYPGGNCSILEGEHGSITEPKAVLKRGPNAPYASQDGWDVLSSREDLPGQSSMTSLDETMLVKPARTSRTSQFSWPLPRRPSLGVSFPLRHLRGSPLSAITESPRTQSTASPRIGIAELPAGLPSSPLQPGGASTGTLGVYDSLKASHDFTSQDSLKPKPLFDLYASSSLSERPKRSRSRLLQRAKTTSREYLVYRPGDASIRHSMPIRSFSWASQASGNPPERPVPPLPADQNPRRKSYHRNNSQQSSRASAVSVDSAGSSILGGSPSRSTSRNGTHPMLMEFSSFLPGSGQGQDPSQYRGSSNIWRSSSVLGFRPPPGKVPTHSPRMHLVPESVRGSINLHSRRPSVDQNMLDEDRYRYPDVGRSTSQRSPNQLSPAPPQRSKSQGSSPAYSRMQGSPSMSPTRSIPEEPQSMVTSPSQVYRTLGPDGYRSTRDSMAPLRTISGNQLNQSPGRTPSLQSSVADANPFHWDSVPLQTGKPSAMKGSPRARRGHRRQNCVRISSQAPMVLGGKVVAQHLMDRPEVRISQQGLDQRYLSYGNPLMMPGRSSIITLDPRLPTPVQVSSPDNSPPRNLSRSPGSASDCVSISSSPQRSPSRLSTGSDVFSPDSSRPLSAFQPHQQLHPLRLSGSSGLGQHPIFQFANASTSPTPSPPAPRAARNHQLRNLKEPPAPHNRLISPMLLPNSSPLASSASPARSASSNRLSQPHRLSHSGSYSHSHSRSRTRSQSAIQGPRSPPPRDLRKSIIALRRMNSEATEDIMDPGSARSSRSYLKLSTPPPPADQLGRPNSRNSRTSLSAVGGGINGAGALAASSGLRNSLINLASATIGGYSRPNSVAAGVNGSSSNLRRSLLRVNTVDISSPTNLVTTAAAPHQVSPTFIATATSAVSAAGSLDIVSPLSASASNSNPGRSPVSATTITTNTSVGESATSNMPASASASSYSAYPNPLKSHPPNAKLLSPVKSSTSGSVSVEQTVRGVVPGSNQTQTRGAAQGSPTTKRDPQTPTTQPHPSSSIPPTSTPSSSSPKSKEEAQNAAKNMERRMSARIERAPELSTPSPQKSPTRSPFGSSPTKSAPGSAPGKMSPTRSMRSVLVPAAGPSSPATINATTANTVTAATATVTAGAGAGAGASDGGSSTTTNTTGPVSAKDRLGSLRRTATTRTTGATVPDTPGSLYDSYGFLKT